MPAWGGAERLAQPIGRGRALLAITTGELYDAAAAELGLLDIVVPRAAFDDTWRALAQGLAATAPGTTRAVKSVIAAAAPTTHQDLEAAASDAFAGSGSPTRTGTPSRRCRPAPRQVAGASCPDCVRPSPVVPRCCR